MALWSGIVQPMIWKNLSYVDGIVMDKYMKAILAVVALSITAWVYLAPMYSYHRHPPYIGHYENVAIWGEGYLQFHDDRPPASAVMYVRVRSY